MIDLTYVLNIDEYVLGSLKGRTFNGAAFNKRELL
jgi:hypothetical protein